MVPKPRGYSLSPRARRDLEEIWRYTFQKWSRAKADDYYHELIDAMLELAGDTRRGKPLDHIRPGYFSLSSGSHFIIYKRIGARISIVRVLHQRMNLGRHL
ncbi:type II toxin-antitoxin system RelE/ParE family toxin [Neorhizobium galegae]|uniref:type II toxin-antitoxin system RelE/ParE family toxin n=1 Tax=Neorhizobium galegae TaxID=399 RepID=UPI0006218026|nr:Hypothetical protein NGAL_HAMBI2605_33550 [Neorhizobium galegae bv. orientalis]